MRLNVYGLVAGISAVTLLIAADVSKTAAPTPAKSGKSTVVRSPAAAKSAAAARPASASPAPANKAAFDAAVLPLFTETCSGCHNESLASGGLNLALYSTPESLVEGRDQWDTILRKLQGGEMPPQGIPRPEEQIAKLTKFVKAELQRSDDAVKPDPGRVTARRLNRTEYTNTIRDLLAVDFRADKNFPTDDSGNGFDNIADILTISPVLMEKYISAADSIAARAIAADPLPKPIEIEYSQRLKNLRRVEIGVVEATHRVEFDAEYKLLVGLPGQRDSDTPPAPTPPGTPAGRAGGGIGRGGPPAPTGPPAKPVDMGVWMDGKLLTTVKVETKPSGLTYFNPYSEEELSLNLPEGDHVFRLGFINDPYVKGMSNADAYSDKKNKFIGSIKFIGPYASKTEKASRKLLLICDPKTGAACVNKILTNVAHRAYRRPVTPMEVASLAKFVALAREDGKSAEQGIELAIEAMLVSPNFLFHIEKDANPTDAERVHKVTDVELASRLSYFLWNSMPDEALSAAAETGKLSTPAVLDAQVKRMLADPKASAMAENFAGQWLEIRNLDSVKPDPTAFPAWGPELREAMKTETQMFFTNILKQNRPISEFLNARYTYLNDFLAKYYGIEGVTGSDFRRVDLATDQRGGILSQGSVLTVSSYPSRTSVVIRGKYILQNILGTPPPPPPPDVPALDEKATGATASLRQQMEKHRANPICASCHSKMDPLGFALENYDAIGKWRTMDGKFPVDSSGVLPSGKSFNGPMEMRQVLTTMLPDFSHCLTEKMLTYALGRGLQRYDKKTVDGIVERVATKGNGLQTLVGEIVNSLPFQSRRGEAVTAIPAKAPAKVVAAK